MKYREASKKLKVLGCEELPRRGAGSHRIWHNLKNGKIAPLPDWGAKDLKLGTCVRSFASWGWIGKSLPMRNRNKNSERNSRSFVFIYHFVHEVDYKGYI